MSVEIRHGVPPLADYLRLRADSGLTPRSEAAAKAGLPNTVAAVTAWTDGRAVGMARAVGCGLNYEVVDVAVHPAHHRQGIGDRMMAALMDRLRAIAPAEAYVSLVADLPADALYARHGFRPVAPASIGMAQWIGRGDAA